MYMGNLAILNRFTQPLSRRRATAGVTLLELLVILALMSIVWAVALPSFSGLLSHERLRVTRDLLLWNLRWCQQTAVMNASAATVRMSMYTPEYTTYAGATPVYHYTFPAGVNYKDGYLQMQTGRITYGSAGTTQMGGVVRLISSSEEMDLTLYIGSGLQSVELNR